ncbi:MAG: tRNA (adenosine(37)-N6)-dimethylallyltransferase MiaA [Erythrobacter sp.]
MSTNTTPIGKPHVTLIAGPTASGKSGLAVELALALEKRGKQAVIINADSAQVYSDLSVLSARPSDEEMRGVEHRLFGKWDGSLACSAADWAEKAKELIGETHTRGAVPILVGGTGMYLQILLEGIAPIPLIKDDIRNEIRALETSNAYAALQDKDPERAAQLNAADSQRIARALEVVRSTGKTLSEWQKHKEGGIADRITLHPLIMLPERTWLYERCDRRFAQMLDEGALEEVAALNARNLDPGLPVMRAIGVPEITAYQRQEITRDELIAAGAQATRNYAKRQYTWFRNQTPEEWSRLESQSYDIDALFVLLLQH